MSRLIDQLNAQIGHEYAAHQQYVAAAVYYDSEALPELAAFFYAQAVEERTHAMMIVRYLIDIDAPVTIPGIPSPKCDFADIAEPVALALEQEQHVSDQFDALAETAVADKDYKGANFLQWFLKEQVEEVATMSDLLTVVRRGQDQPLLIEEYLARNPFGGGGDEAGAPAVAGG
jgi:bacterioferritin B